MSEDPILALERELVGAARRLPGRTSPLVARSRWGLRGAGLDLYRAPLRSQGTSCLPALGRDVYPDRVDLGSPISYEVLAKGTSVLSADGVEIGTVHHVLADESADVFDGIVIAERVEGHRFADADDVQSIYERGVVLKLDAAACADLPRPSANPAVMRDDPAAPANSALSGKLHRAWNLLSGNY
ncbi:MAG: hypothetical protein ACRDMJ_03105 [Solirubrobacteraceae bacterium]